MEEQHLPEFHCLGRSSCGSVWAVLERGSAFKRDDGSTSRSLQNDVDMHQRVLESINRLMEIKKTRISPAKRDEFPQIQVPECRGFITSSNHWWMANISRFPDDYQPCKALESQRIPPFSEATREVLIQNYCAPDNRLQASAYKVNHDCIIRPYLGRRRIRKEPSKFLSLRNFPFHVDQVEDIGLSASDMNFYSLTMAETLVTMHWISRVDGNDVEFVLAPPDGQKQGDIMTNILGDHTMWMFDFDLCRDMEMDEEGVRKAVRAYWRNDPFYPRPGKGPWEDFREQYLQTSHEICESSELLGLSKLFIDFIEQGIKD